MSTERPPIDTAKIRACLNDQDTPLVIDLCDALDAEQVRVDRLAADFLAVDTARDLTIQNLRAEVAHLQRECAISTGQRDEARATIRRLLDPARDGGPA